MRILLIEDDKRLSYSLQFKLEKQDFVVDTCFDGQDAYYYINENCPDIILLDRMLPNVDGLTILKHIRDNQNSTPVIILTAMGELGDKITGLDCGADDYLVKPFEIEELLARIRSLSRRPKTWTGGNELSFSDITYHTELKLLTSPKGTCTLSNREGKLLELFMKNSNQTLPRSTIITKVWGPASEIEGGNLDNYVYFLRRRLHQYTTTLTIKTVRGIGYCLIKQESSHV